MTRFRDRREQHVEHRRQGPSSEVSGGDNLTRLRREAGDILAAGNDAIDRALSGDSEAFLRANRQQGGQ
jgi:hypothetical protein